jgi:1-acyl-sn-glycerol-3-phosphate acyltransferase
MSVQEQVQSARRWLGLPVRFLAAYSVMLPPYLFFRTLCRGTITGREHLEGCLDEGFILAANHSSYLDWMVLAGWFRFSYRGRIVFFAKEKLFRHPIFGPTCDYEKCVKVSNDGSRVLDRRDLSCIPYLGIFPEGGRAADGRLGPGHSGVVRLSATLGKPVLPVGLSGFYEAWPRGRKYPWPHKCSIAIGAPMRFGLSDIEPDDACRQATDQVMQRIADLSCQTKKEMQLCS